MTTATRSPSPSQRRRAAHRRPSQTAAEAPSPAGTPRRGGTVVFEIPLTSAMHGSDLELLRRQLAMTTHVEHKLPVDPNSPGHAQLDQDSGLLLERGPGQDRWLLQARTWGRPSPRTVHDWQVRVAQVARRLDPQVAPPARLPREPAAVPVRPVGHALNGRLAAARRRLTGIPPV